MPCPLILLAMPITSLLYLHGFRSSPKSTKARMVEARVKAEHPQVHWWCPQLPPSPKVAMEMLEDGVAGWHREEMAVIGSSLGGFYATRVAQEMGCKAVVLNPAVDPSRDLARHIGVQTAWHDEQEKFFFEPRFVDQLRELQAGPLQHPEKFFAVIAKGDEVLDWREMTARYQGARIKLLEGSDHAISDFGDHIADVFAFLGLA
jgi:predicted esterase YcpF (UPF0227 family)